MDGAQADLFSMLIECDSGTAGLTDTVASILVQDYAHVEVVVGILHPNMQDERLVSQLAMECSQRGIEGFSVVYGSEGMTKVELTELMCRRSVGDVLFPMTCGDTWREVTTLSMFARALSRLGRDGEFVTSQVEYVMSGNGKPVQTIYPTFDVQLALKNGDMPTLRNTEVCDSVLPWAGSAYRRSFFEKVGPLSPSFSCDEQWPVHLMWLLRGNKVFLLDRVTLTTHREPCGRGVIPKGFYHEDADSLLEEIELHKDTLSSMAYNNAIERHTRRISMASSSQERISIVVSLSDLSVRQQDRLIGNLLSQRAENLELIVGCSVKDTDRVIGLINEAYVSNPFLKRVRIVEVDSADASLRNRPLEEYAMGTVVMMRPGMMLADNDSILRMCFESEGEEAIESEFVPLDNAKRPVRGGKPVKKIQSYGDFVAFSSPDSIRLSLVYLLITVLAWLALSPTEGLPRVALLVVLFVEFLVTGAKMCIFAFDALTA